MTYRVNPLKQKLAAGGRLLGCWVCSGSSVITELLSLAGFDYLLIDQEHGVGDNFSLVHQLQAMTHNPAASIVRVPVNDQSAIKRVLDAGAEGIMIPNVNTAEEARAAIAACRYPSAGIRGAGWGGARVAKFGLMENFPRFADENLVIVLQIETVEAVHNIDAILAVDGYDVVFIGPTDLSGSVGYLGDSHHPDVQALIDTAERKILAAGKAMGTVPFQRKWQDLFGRGYTMINSTSDISALRDRALSDIKVFQDLPSASAPGCSDDE